MNNNKSILWEKISNYGISTIGKIQPHKGGYLSISGPTKVDEEKLFGRFEDFNFNINRIMIIYDDLLNSNQNTEKDLVLKNQLYYEIIIILLMTSLEAYLRDTFIGIISNIKEIKNSNSKQINNIYKKIKKNIPVFQQDNYVKLAYSVLGINVLNIIEIEIWKRIFSRRKYNSMTHSIGYMKMRHIFIHEGASKSLFKELLLDEEFIETAILDVVKLVFNIQIRIPDYTWGIMIDSVELFKQGKIKFLDKNK